MPDMPGQTLRCLINMSREQRQQDLLMVLECDLHAFGIERVLDLKQTDLTAQQREAVDQAAISRCARDEHMEPDVDLEKADDGARLQFRTDGIQSLKMRLQILL